MSGAVTHLVFVNHSTRVTDAELAAVVVALRIQVARDFAPAWGLVPAALAVATPTAVPPGAALIALVDTPDQADALGYHDDESGAPRGYVFADPVLDNGGTVLGDPGDPGAPCVASVLSHEALELLADAACNAWRDGPPLEQGAEYAQEVADPVRASGYAIDANGTAVVVSDFVTPAWFDPQATAGPFDYLGALAAPFAMSPGGYMIVRDASGSESAVYGAQYARWRRAMRAPMSSRRSRRGVLGAGPVAPPPTTDPAPSDDAA